ncbi:hypothetical protein M427DRAFT_280615 [Gonapodya prolifera JEL478]|uniref:Dynein regulatory complex protein 10 n=1 Tax=Gonapodya prolifera (strain JEL478) TaxID=1344416 RepID=A0A139AYP3_GONPJ|nr:hypothetical protein M427DRAFT_280615 [Gonapodya prolifera JEL478]|eukprot:KXS21868.1 hypothetical protein M427DRAFT_280615 [Gonapodya prolifera JEL478]
MNGANQAPLRGNPLPPLPSSSPPSGSVSSFIPNVQSHAIPPVLTSTRSSLIGSTTQSTPHKSMDDVWNDEHAANLAAKLPTPQAQRVLAVLQELQRKVLLVGMLPDTIDRKVTTVFGPELTSVLQEHRQLESRLDSLMEIKDRGVPEADTDAFRNEVRETSQHLHASIRTVERVFLRNRESLSKLLLLRYQRNPAVVRFEALIAELKGILFEKLRQGADEERETEEKVKTVAAREQKTTAEVKQLQEELRKARLYRSQEINSKNDVIRRLKDELRSIKDSAEDATRKTELKSKQKEESDLREFADREKVLLADIAQLSADLSSLRSTHRGAELTLRKRNAKTQSEVENWIHKYDQDMGERQSELDELTAQHGEERTQLDELKEKHETLSREWERIKEERKRAEERKKEERQLAVKVTAATKIQAVWRGYVVRRDLRKKKSKSVSLVNMKF